MLDQSVEREVPSRASKSAKLEEKKADQNERGELTIALGHGLHHGFATVVVEVGVELLEEVVDIPLVLLHRADNKTCRQRSGTGCERRTWTYGRGVGGCCQSGVGRLRPVFVLLLTSGSAGDRCSRRKTCSIDRLMRCWARFRLEQRHSPRSTSPSPVRLLHLMPTSFLRRMSSSLTLETR